MTFIIGADIEAKDQNGDTPLTLACQNNHLEVIKLLLEKGLLPLLLATSLNTCYTLESVTIMDVVLHSYTFFHFFVEELTVNNVFHDS